MREIKFRAWDTKEKKWLYGYDYPELGGFSLKGECILLGEFGSDMPLERFLNDVEIMQFTGLKDRDGKEIYEGDIVHQSGYMKGFNHQVVFYDSRFCLVYDGIHTDHIFTPNVEVIGNIYENKELLK